MKIVLAQYLQGVRGQEALEERFLMTAFAVGTVMIGAAVYRVFLWLDKRRRVAKINIPLVKGGFPLVGHVPKMVALAPWDLMVEWTKEYGSFFRFKMFTEDCLVCTEPAILKEVFQTSISSFQKDVEFTYKPFMVLLGTGLVTSEGSIWLKQRAAISPVFKNEILTIIPDIAKRAVERLAVKLETLRGTGKSIDIGEEFRHLTLQVIAEALLSIPADESDQTFSKMYLPIMTEGNTRVWYPHRGFLPTYDNWKFHQHVRELNAYIVSIITKRWEQRKRDKVNGGSKKREDVLDRLIAGIDEKDWGSGTIKQLRDEFKTFILAGHETSASMLTWALYELTNNASYLEKVVEEADKTFGKDNHPTKPLPTNDKINEGLVYTLCCLKEALRKYSIVPVVVRQAVKDVVLVDKYPIPAGTRIMLLMQGVHHRADIWPEPKAFKPERFLEPPAPFTFLPFIDGPRNCLGQYLALLESKIVLATLCQRFRFRCVGDNAGRKHPWIVPVVPDEPGLHVVIE